MKNGTTHFILRRVGEAWRYCPFIAATDDDAIRAFWAWEFAGFVDLAFLEARPGMSRDLSDGAYLFAYGGTKPLAGPARSAD